MSIEITEGSPLAQRLQEIIQPKLVELGWGSDDSTLSEYVILMLINGRTQEQIASDLSNDLLGLGPDDPGAADFSRWLFEQITILNEQRNPPPPTGPSADQGAPDITEAPGQEMDTGDSTESKQIPTGPKAMRQGSQNESNNRMMNQLNRAMDRKGDSALRRVQDRGGTGRINSRSREPPKGPRSQGARNMAATNRMGGMSVAGMPGGPMGYPGMDMSAQASAANMFAQFGQWAEQMSKMPPEMQAQFFANQGMGPMGQFGGTGFQNGMGHGQGQGRGRGRGGKSMFDRVERGQHKQNGFGQKKNHQDTEMSDAASAGNGEGMDVEAPTKDPFEIVCRFNKNCQKPDCPFAHQTPASHTPVSIDLADTCAHGVACKNYKCVARHPSPAKIAEHHAQENCKFWPNCTNPHCTFKHVPICRNGADCNVADCKFTHVKTQCKYNPCLNPKCPYKHSEGQERGKFSDKVWTADGAEKSHVSERRFVSDGDKPEELIIPGKEGEQEGVPAPEPVATS